MDRLASVNLPAFPLQLLLRRHPEWAREPVAVVAEDQPQGRVFWMNEKARLAGVLPGLRYAAASSLAPGLRAGVISDIEVKGEIAIMAKQLTRFTPHVEASTEEPGVFWLSGAGLALLHPCLKKWARAVHKEIHGRGFSASVVVGFTRFGTYASARAHQGVVVFEDPSEERAAARKVPLGHLNLDPDLRETLFKLGVKTVGGFLSLPAGGLRERFGPKVYRLYRMASGDLSEPLHPCAFMEPVEQKLFFDHPEADTMRLTFMIKRLLHPMLSELAARGEALVELLLRILIERSGSREERIRPAAPTLESVQVLELVRLRLEAMRLPAGVVEIELTATGVPVTREQLRLFVERPLRDLNAANRALARLRTEFGHEAVVRAKLNSGHLPEARFSWEPLPRVELPRPKEAVQRTLVRRILAKPVSLPSEPRHTRDDGWLVLGPRSGAVTKLSGPYLFSGAWWAREIHREYHFAETRRGNILWVYYDRPRRRWFLQGWVE